MAKASTVQSLPLPETTKRGTSGAKALEARKVSVDAWMVKRSGIGDFEGD